MTSHIHKAVVIFTISFLSLCVVAQDDPNKSALEFIDSFKDQKLKKDEFETTSEHLNRISGFSGKEIVVSVAATSPSLGTKVFSYDADSRKLIVRLIGHGVIPVIRVVDSRSDAARSIGSQGMLTLGFQKFLIKNELGPSKEYPSQNAMGAQTMVKQITSKEWSLGLSNILSDRSQVPQQFELVVDANRAKKIVESSRWKLYATSIVLPGQSDFIVSDGEYKKPTIDNPIEIAISGRTLMGILRRAELIDSSTGEILVSFRTGADYPIAPISGARVLLGVTCVALTKELSTIAKYSSQNGCMVGGVTPDSVASKSGIRAGDVLVSINGVKVSTPDDLIATVKSLTPGQSSRLVVWRNEQEIAVQANF
jgi:hypothetical protein